MIFAVTERQRWTERVRVYDIRNVAIDNGCTWFCFNENALCLTLLISGIGVATREFEDLKQRVDWLETRLDDKKDGADNG